MIINKVDVIIINWNSGSQLRECIESVLEHGGNHVSKLIVVDNASTDGSGDVIASLPRVQIIRSPINLGFAAACNLGAGEGNSPYILFLNPDTRLEPGALSVPLSFMDGPEGKDIGICGIQLFDDTGKVSRTCARFPSFSRITSSVLGLNKIPGCESLGMSMQEWDHEESRIVDQVIGAFFMVRRKLFAELGGFDERFFVYFEEVDFSARAKLNGWKSIYLAGVRAYHAGGGTSRQVKDRRLFYYLRSRIIYGFKHFPRWQAWALVGLTSGIEPVSRIFWCMARRDFSGARHTISAYRMFWRSLGKIIRGEGRFEP